MRLIALAAASMLAALALLACGGSDSAPAAPVNEPQTTAASETAADVPDDAVVSASPKIYFIHTDW